MREYALPLIVALLLVVAGCSSSDAGGYSGAQPAGGDAGGDGAGAVGLAAGGAADATAFRNNVREGYVPQPTDITPEGLFHDYYFDTRRDRECEALFCPSYSRAVTRDPLSNGTERYLTVGLNSGLSEADFERKKLNLVVVLDTSGSMSSRFSEYYYDEDGEKRTVEDGTSKMAAARESVVALTEHLDGDDRFGLVTYDSNARVVQSLRRVDETDVDHLRERVRGLEAGGSTNLDAGMTTAEEMLQPHRNADRSEYETRVVYVTDAMPNVGDTSGAGLGARLQENAEHGVHSTFVGVGVDFNSRLVETINDVPGANHYTVHSPDQFRERMDEGFDYMVTPLVFDLTVAVESEGYEIAEVYGSPSADGATGELLSVNTLFPSRTEDNRTEGGVILVRLRDTSGGDELRLTASYETRTGETRETTRTVAFGDHEAPYYGGSGVRKAVVLSRYADLMRNWAAYERAHAAGEAETPADGIEHRSDLGRWEQQSLSLRVSEPYVDRIERFETYFRAEMRALDAGRMEQDAAILATLRTNATAENAAETNATNTNAADTNETDATATDATAANAVSPTG